MSTSAKLEKYAVTASSAMIEEISERIRQLTHRVRAMRQQLQAMLANVPEQTLRVLRQRIQVHQQEILRLEHALAKQRDRNELQYAAVSTS